MSSGNRKDRETVRTIEHGDLWTGPEDRRPFAARLQEVLEGRSIDQVIEPDTLVLDNGVRLRFDQSNSSCCSWIELDLVRATYSIITKVEVTDDEEEAEKNNTSEFKAKITVLTESGKYVDIAEAHGDFSNGYYLHGFALDVEVIEP